MSVADQATHPATVNTWLDSRSITISTPSSRPVTNYFHDASRKCPILGDELLFLFCVDSKAFNARMCSFA